MKHAKRLRAWAIKKLDGCVQPKTIGALGTVYLTPTRIVAQEIVVDSMKGDPFVSETAIKRRLADYMSKRIIEDGYYTMEKIRHPAHSIHFDETNYRMTVWVYKPEEQPYEG